VARPHKYTEEFRRDAVALVRDQGMPVRRAAADLGIHSSVLDGWLKADREARGETAARKSPSTTALSATEREELRRLRRRVVELEEEREVLKKAAAFFAKETTR
jgi:transposase